MDFVLKHEPGAPLSIPQIDFRGDLNDEQYAAVTAPPGPLLVLAGAGSGKTRTLTYRVAHLLTQGVKPHEILLLTFTNKAAREMLHRVQDLTGVEAHRFWGGTFHHIGHKILRIYGDAIGLPRAFTILDADEADGLLRDTVEDRDKTFFKDKTHPRPGPLFEIISFSRNTQRALGETIDRFYPQHEAIADDIGRFAAAYRERKRKQSVVDYDDLLEYWLELLRAAPDVATYLQQRFRQVLVDEYQDTNTLQAQIVDIVGAHHRVMAVGDDAQCIYSWRGANFENIITFPDRHPGTQIYRIETNYRSTPSILAFANGVLAAQPKGRHFEKELRPARPDHEKPYLVQALDTREQALFVIQRIKGLVDEGRMLADIAVLYRAHFQALDLQLASRDALRDHKRRAVLRAGAHPRSRGPAALCVQPGRHHGLAAHRGSAAARRRQGGAEALRHGTRQRARPAAQPRGRACCGGGRSEGAQGCKGRMAASRGFASAGGGNAATGQTLQDR
jgi:DNA helicase-2/ATP-dependent DNA helicase PcrA